MAASKSPPWATLYDQWLKAKPGPAKQHVLGKLVAKFEPLISGVIHRYRDTDVSMREDLSQAGRMGIMRAVEKFDPQKREAFPPYALLWVKEHVRREYRLLHGMSSHGIALDYEEFKEHVRLLGSRNPSPEENILAEEEKARWAEWVPGAKKVLNDGQDKNDYRRLRRQLTNKIDEDHKAKCRAIKERRLAKDKPS